MIKTYEVKNGKIGCNVMTWTEIDASEIQGIEKVGHYSKILLPGKELLVNMDSRSLEGAVAQAARQ